MACGSLGTVTKRSGIRPGHHIRPKSEKKARMRFLWLFFKAVTLVLAVIIAVLVVVDGSLLANLLGKKNE